MCGAASPTRICSSSTACNCSLSTNNILNPSTPYGDCSLIRMANLHANVLQVGHAERIAECFEMLTTRSARLMNLNDYGFAVGNPADVVVIDAANPGAGGRRNPPSRSPCSSAASAP